MRPPPPPPDAAEMTEQFTADFDTDGSGTIDKAEISAVLADKGVEDPDGMADAMLSDLGSTDGTLTRDQVQTAFEAREQAMNERLDGMRAFGRPPPTDPAAAIDADSLFSQLDGNGDGSVSSDELKSLLSQATGSGTSASDAGSRTAEPLAARFAALIARYQSLSADTTSSGTLAATA
ncbi:MAG TPA: hypothetical protein PKA20_12845 [Burkholderiaceae bacterium]|nr:hypothetical protein [Burkholderiaceae bacterium]